MSSPTTLINCPAIQDELNGYFGANPTQFTEKIQLTQFLNSEFNRVGVSQVQLKERVAPGGGKKRQVQLVYSPRLLESSVRRTRNESCVGGPIPQEFEQTYEIIADPYEIDMQVDPRDLSDICEENTSFVAKKIAQLINVLDRRIETEAYTTLPLLTGNFSSDEPDVSNKIKPVQTEVNGSFSMNAATQISMATQYAGYPTSPIVFGGRKWTEYFNKVQAGCCSMEGIDLAELASKYPYVFIPSYRADVAFGDDNAITVAPGAVQMLEYMEYEGMSFLDRGTLQQWTIVSPVSGLRYDMKLYIDCNGIFNFTLRKYFQLVTMPDDVYLPGDRLYGVTRVNEFEISNS